MAEGTVPDALYVVRFGFVEVSCGGQEVLVAKRGDVIGENALCGLSEIKRRKRTARAKTVLAPCTRPGSKFPTSLACFGIPGCVCERTVGWEACISYRERAWVGAKKSCAEAGECGGGAGVRDVCPWQERPRGAPGPIPPPHWPGCPQSQPAAY
eukprot:2705696-Rhodomonas_salina.6